MAADINLNAAECIVRKSSIGHDVVTNICSGATVSVPWQAGDWIEAVAFGSTMLLLIGLLIVLAFMFFQMARDGF